MQSSFVSQLNAMTLNGEKKARRTLGLLTVYGVAMALLEAAVVVYLRLLYYPENPVVIFPLKFMNAYDVGVELSREAATVVMILTVAMLAESGSRTRLFAAFVFVFGVWDIFYYAWLKFFIDWPVSWLEWDVLFLIPTVWLGPWLCPVMISSIFIVWGGRNLLCKRTDCLTRKGVMTFIAGSSLALLAFLQPAWSTLAKGGMEALSQYTPETFWWGLFLPGLLLMVRGLWNTAPVPLSN